MTLLLAAAICATVEQRDVARLVCAVVAEMRLSSVLQLITYMFDTSLKPKVRICAALCERPRLTRVA